MTQADASTIKQQQKEQWGRAAEGWKKQDAYIRERTEPVTRRMLELAAVAPGKRVLDIASGTGEPAVPAARIVGDNGHVLATDQAPEMLDIAREKAQNEGLSNMEFRLADGEEIDVPAESFDAVTCRWGLMFMPEPVRFLRRAHQALKPGGRIALATWGPPPENPWVGVPMMILRKYYSGPALPDPTSPGGMFSFASEESLKSALEQAGFSEPAVERMELPMSVFPSAREWWAFQMEVAGPLQTIFRQLSPEDQEAATREALEAATQGRADGSVSLNGVALIASAAK
jgi:ubiquinone/menaquinone biosynthesis C-methylase UbiE